MAELRQQGASIAGVVADSDECGSGERYEVDAQLSGVTLVGHVRPPRFDWPMYGSVESDTVTFRAFNVKWQFHRAP